MTYSQEARIESIDSWKKGTPSGIDPSIGLHITIPADKFTGLDLTQPITITQEGNDE